MVFSLTYKELSKILCLSLIILISSGCSHDKECKDIVVSGIWTSRETIYSRTSANEGKISIMFTPQGDFYPLCEAFDQQRYRHYKITRDSLMLISKHGMRSYFHITFINDTVFAIDDYPEYGETHKFEKRFDIERNNCDYSYIPAYQYSEDSLDIRLTNVKQCLYPNSKTFVLSHFQMLTAKKILTDFYHEGYLQWLYEKQIRVRLGYPLDLYFKRYIGFVQDGEKKVFVALDYSLNFVDDNFNDYDDIKNTYIRYIQDGGPGIGEVIINLDSGKVELINIHGNA